MKPILILSWILVALGIATVVQVVGPYVTGALLAVAIFFALKNKSEAG